MDDFWTVHAVRRRLTEPVPEMAERAEAAEPAAGAEYLSVKGG